MNSHWSLRSALSEQQFDGEHVAAPARGLTAYRARTGGGEPIVFRPPPALGDAPFAVDPVVALEALERGVERALVHLEGALRHLLDALADPPAVHRCESERLEHQEVDRAAQRLGGGFAHEVPGVGASVEV